MAGSAGSLISGIEARKVSLLEFAKLLGVSLSKWKEVLIGWKCLVRRRTR